ALRIALEAGGGTNVTITTTNGGASGSGFGDITVASALTWTPSTASTLTLSAARDVNINADISPTRGNLVVCCGRDINVRAVVTTVNGSVLLSAGRDLNITRVLLDPAQPLLGRTNVAGIRTTDGNITMCAAHDIKLTNSFDAAALITETTSSTTGGLDLAELGVKAGMVISAGTGGTGPGVAGGTAILTPMVPGTSLITVTDAPISINYNPVSYLAPNDYSSNFTRTNAALTQRMLVFPQGDKTADGSALTTLSATLKGSPAGVTLLSGAGATASFDTAAVGVGKPISFSGYTLDVASQAIYALPIQCCGPLLGRGLTSGTILPVAVIPPVVPPVVPPVIVPPEVGGGGIPVGVDVPIPLPGPTPTADIFATPPENFPVDHVPGVLPPWVSTVVVSETPPQLLSLVTPPVQLPPAPPIVNVVVPKAAPAPPPVFVPPPPRERKHERN
ncbi:MAG: hypothetical protein H7346_14225, partial [Burkholderiaceae bacterium]|nr:hypothetical protein [Burkholderiaceae bacterium]